MNYRQSSVTMVGLMGYAENDTVEIMATNLREVCISLNLTKGIKGGV